MEFFEIFSYDFGNSNVHIHPSYVCDPFRGKLKHYKKSDKKTLTIDIAPFDSHFEQCFCSTRKCLLVFRTSRWLNNVK